MEHRWHTGSSLSSLAPRVSRAAACSPCLLAPSPAHLLVCPAQPFTFSAGQPVSGPNTKMVESAGGLFAGGGGIKPPAALSESVVGMRAGGKRSLLVPPELGYGAAGEQEIPPNCPSFELQVELLSVE